MNISFATFLPGLRRAFHLGAVAGVMMFVIGAVVVSPMAFYVGCAVGNGASIWLKDTAVSFLAPVVNILGILATAGVFMTAAGIWFGLLGWTLEATTRLTIRALRRWRSPPQQ